MVRLIAISLLVCATSYAQAAEDSDLAREAMKRGEILPLSRILSIAEQVTGGRMMDLELDRHGGRYVYDLKMIDTKGQMIELKLDASNGRILELETDD
ncbi:PepSY domain-containing protein [Rhizobium sp. AN80A]|uniref:PepSY domain-containing protein n=1 Tax=Rhizobium sp. AN80A TaxID=3040673 RepID=UPI0024B3B4CA|nr:PepSY domain-containing protein [Rhizobium sp. AN80A]